MHIRHLLQERAAVASLGALVPPRQHPITIAFVFGLRTLEQIDAAFPGRLYDVVTSRHVGTGR